MEPQTLTMSNRKLYNPNYISDRLQKGHIKAAKYRHSIRFPMSVFNDLRNAGVMDIEIWLADELCFFEFKGNNVILSFVNQKYINDFHLRAYHFVLMKAIGADPFIRTGQSIMNSDKSINKDILKLTR